MRVVAVAFVVAASVMVPSHASEATGSFAAYGADATGTAVHLRSSTNALSNFANGFIDNYFPLATTHMDASPATTAAATIADSGPGGGFIDFEANGKLPQTQYALAGSPGPPSASLSQQGSIATATATPTSADARAAVASTTSGGPNASPSTTMDTEGDAGDSHVITDGTTVKATSSGTLSHVSIGGVLDVDGLTTSASVVANAAGATTSYTVTAASVKVAGQAVGVTEKGIVPAGGSVPVATLNQALSAAGISVATVAPVVTRTGSTATIDVVGLAVTITAPNPTPSVPTLVTKIVLGESRAFAFATPGVAVPTSTEQPVLPSPETATGPIEVPPAVTAPAEATIATPSSGPSLSAPAAGLAARNGAGPVRLVVTRHRPTPLLWMYLVWQALVIGNAAVIVWWRRGAAPA